MNKIAYASRRVFVLIIPVLALLTFVYWSRSAAAADSTSNKWLSPPPSASEKESDTADTGSNFRTDSCQYVYNLSASALGIGTYRVEIKIGGIVVGSTSFGLK